MNKSKALIIIISFTNYLEAGEPPRQPHTIGVAARVLEPQEVHRNYTFDNKFLAGASCILAVGAGLYAYGEYGMKNEASLDKERHSLAPVFAGVAAIKLLFIGCGGCMAYWQERLLEKEHTE